MFPAPPVVTPHTARTTALEVLEGADLTGRRAMVTGGASGFGADRSGVGHRRGRRNRATRRPELAEPLSKELRAAPRAGTVRTAEVDLASLASVDSLNRFHPVLKR
jgi:NAD(P)-dependent dehydrogenase (short-subunit alcohol dehydrogenase family)